MKFKSLLLKLQGLSKIQMMIAAITGTVVVGGAGTGIYYLANSNQPQEIVSEVAMLEEEPEVIEPIEEEPEVETEKIVDEVVESEPEAPQIKQLTLVGTSMEKDLKIKVQDQNSKLVTGELFSVSVKPDKKGGKAKAYEDDDKDGIIYIEKMDAGDYTVDLTEVEGYEVKEGSIKVKVKDKLEYKKVDVTSEIKDESEVNTAVEDTAKNDIPVEAVLTDTVPLIESTMTPTKVEKSAVDQSGFTKAAASGGTPVTLKKTVVTIKPAEPPVEPIPEDPTASENNAGGEKEPPAPPEEITETTETTATVSLPGAVTLYNCDNPASNSYALSMAVSGDTSIVKSVAWSSTNAGITLSAKSGTAITITNNKTGSGSGVVTATITYDSDGKETTKTATLTTTVTLSNITDAATPLKDKTGSTLYLDEKATKIATLKDFATAAIFYKAPKYTGWQTLDGKVYYYNAQNAAITGNQIIGGITYTFAADGSLTQSSGSRGIDVSKYQGNIDWGAVASSGISFAIIRVGYRGSSTGALVEDPYFRQNIAGATKAGIKVGVYFFTQAISEAEAVEEASMAMSLVSGYKVTYPIFIDTESATNGRANGLDVATRTAVVRAFCQTVANGGYKPGVYASKNWYNTKLTASSLNNYCIWVAQYNSVCNYSGKYNMWQYSSTGRVAGIKGNVDMNISYLGY